MRTIIMPVAHSNDVKFFAMVEAVDALLQPLGLLLDTKKGSASWLNGRTYSGRPFRQVLVKLVFQSDAKPYLLCIRKDFADAVAKLLGLKWQAGTFTIAPTAVEFVGFELSPGDVKGLARARVIIDIFPPPSPRSSDFDEFDRQLQRIAGTFPVENDATCAVHDGVRGRP